MGRSGSVYAIVNDWPTTDTLSLGSVTATGTTTVSMLGYSGKIPLTINPSGGVYLNIGGIAANRLPCEWAWVFKFGNIQSANRYKVRK